MALFYYFFSVVGKPKHKNRYNSQNSIEEIIKYFRAQYNPKSDDKIGLLIKNMVEKDVWIPMTKNVDLTPASIFERIFKIQQSNTELTFNRAVVIEITHVTI